MFNVRDLPCPQDWLLLSLSLNGASDPPGFNVAVINDCFCSHHFVAHSSLPTRSSHPGVPARPYIGGVILVSPRIMTLEQALARIVDE